MRNSKLLKTPEPDETGYCGDCIHCHGIDEQRDVCICDIDNPHKDWRYNYNEPCCDWEMERKSTKPCRLSGTLRRHERLRTSSTKSLEELKKLWKEFSGVPINNDDEIERPFLSFDVGTDRFEIWRWFDEQCPNGIKQDLVGTEYEE